MHVPCLQLLLAAVVGLRVGSSGGSWVGVLAWQAAALAAVVATLCCCRRRPSVGPLWQPGRRRLGPLSPAWVAVALAFAALGAATVGPAPEPVVAHVATYLVQVVGPVGHQALPAPGRVRLKLRLLARRSEAPEQASSPWRPASGVGTVRLPLTWPAAHGDALLLALEVRALRPQAAPWLPTPAQLARSTGVTVRLRPRGPAASVQLAHGPWATLDRLRLGGARFLTAQLPPPAASLAKALALGDTADLSPAQREAWATAGTAHLLAVSGLHVGILARLAAAPVLWLATGLRPRALRRGTAVRLAAAVGTAAAWGYAVLTGGSLPALRAATMWTLANLGRLVGGGSGGGNAANLLGLSGLVLLLHAPAAVDAPSFWLSFVAVAALTLGPSPQRLRPPPLWLPAPSPSAAPRGRIGVAGLLAGWERLPAPARRAAFGVLGALEEGLAVSVATIPCMAAFFAQLPLLAPFVNVVAVPVGALLATPLTLACLALAPLQAVPGGALCCRAAAWILAHALRGLDATMASIGDWPLSRCNVAAPPLWLCGPWTVVLLFGRAALRPWPPLRRHLALWGSALATTAVASSWPLPHAPDAAVLPARDRRLHLWHVDVGHGDATLVRAPGGGWLLVDGGGALFADAPDPGRGQLAQALRALGVRRFAAVVLTHPHPDHFGGLTYVLTHWPTAALWWNEDAARAPWLRPLAALARRQGAQVGPPPATWAWQGLDVQFVLPLAGRPASANDHAIAAWLQYRNSRVLLAADLEAAGETALVQQKGERTGVDWLKVAHHGSATSTTAALLAAVPPRFAIISCGEANRFGFPAPAVLARLTAVGATIYDTGTHGTIHASTDGSNWWVQWGGRPWADYAAGRYGGGASTATPSPRP